MENIKHVFISFFGSDRKKEGMYVYIYASM